MADTDEREEAIRSLMPLLIDLHRNLDGRLSLARLATERGYSPSHFHRVFTSAVGETPRAHVERLRMEKAAYKLWISADSVLDVALSIGFRSHETFSRAFKRYFGASPQTFRKNGRTAMRQRIEHYTPWTPDDCVLSSVRYEILREMPLLTLRYVGDYSDIPQPGSARDRHWRVLTGWAHERHVSYQPIALSIFHDNPWLTPKDHQRADLCLPLASAVAGARSIRCTRFVAGLYAAITHMGPLSTRHRAFRHLADAVHASDQYAFPSEPAVAISMAPLDEAQAAVYRTNVYLPVIRKA